MQPIFRWGAVAICGSAGVAQFYFAVTTYADASSLALWPTPISIEAVEAGGLPDGHVQITGGMLIPSIAYSENPGRTHVSRGAHLVSEASLLKWNAREYPGTLTDLHQPGLLVGMDEKQMTRLWPILKNGEVYHDPAIFDPLPYVVAGELLTLPRPGESLRPEMAGLSFQYLAFEQHPLRTLSFHSFFAVFLTFTAYRFARRVNPVATPDTQNPGASPNSRQAELLI